MTEQKYYTRDQIIELFQVPQSTLDNWSRKLRGTDMVRRAKTSIRQRQLVYSQDFLTFLLSRVDNTGPSNLPEPAQIAALYAAVREGKTPDQIAIEQGVPLPLIQAQLEAVGVIR